MSNVEIKELNGISIEDFRQALIANGVEWAKEVAPQIRETTRIETKRSWEIEGREASDEEIDLFQEMPFIMGSSVSPVEPRELTQEEIDDVVYEVTSVNKTKDMLEGRIAKIRQTVFDAATFAAQQDGLEDPEYVAMQFPSEKYGLKVCREVTGGKAFIDMDLAREVFGEMFDKVVNRIETIKVTYGPDGAEVSEETSVSQEINEQALETQVALGNITLEQLAQATATTKKVAKFITRKL